MLTHGPPRGVLDQTIDGEDVGCDPLWTAVRRARPRLHVFGHIHEGWGAERVDWKEGMAEQVGMDDIMEDEDEDEEKLEWGGQRIETINGRASAE